MFDPSWPHVSQNARPPCPSPTPGLHRDSRPSSQWCHTAILSSVIPFSCHKSLPASESFLISQCFAWGGQSAAVSASASTLQRNSRADLLQNGLVGSPCSPRNSQESSPTPQFKSINSLTLSLLHSPRRLSHPYMTTGKPIALTRQTFVGKVMSRAQYMLFLFSIRALFLTRTNLCMLSHFSHVQLSATVYGL